MNLSLVDPFILAQDYPEVHAGHLRSGHATCLRFNHRGDFLASGRVDGTVVIFDIETNGVARKLRGHTRQMQSLRKLVSRWTIPTELFAGLEMHSLGPAGWLEASSGQI